MTSEHSNRQDRKWDCSGRITALLPHNGSRRVTQRTHAHLKPISLFPIHASDGSFALPPPRFTYETPSIPSVPIREIPSGALKAPMSLKTPPTYSGATPRTSLTQSQSSPARHSPPTQRLPLSIMVPPPLRFQSPQDHLSPTRRAPRRRAKTPRKTAQEACACPQLQRPVTHLHRRPILAAAHLALLRQG